MNRKVYNLLLIFVVITLWIVIGTRFYSLIENRANNNVAEAVLFLKKPELDVDSIQLTLNYRDPFLGKSYPITVETELKPASISPYGTSGSKKATLKWPVITYSGMIKPAKGRTSVAVLTIDGQPFLLRNNEELYGLRTLSICQDSLVVEFEDEKRSFKKSLK